VILFPNGKINLGLHITNKRSDGYHNLETVFFPVKWYDVLEIIPAGKSGDANTFSGTGIIATKNGNENICVKAYETLKYDFPNQLPPVQFYLHKTIPIGAGLGGGSADGAFTLKLLNQQFQLGLSPEQLIIYAGRLGSDCPFFIINRPCFATGRGEILETVTIDLSAYKLLLVNPSIEISTKDAFAKLVPAFPEKSLKEIISQPVNTWRANLKNDFEALVSEHWPEIGSIKRNLYDAGAIYASMTGSGSTVYGIFHKDDKISVNFPPHYTTKESAGELN